MGQHRRNATLDLTDDQLESLLAQAASLAAREIQATRDGPVFAHRPSAQRLQRLLDGDPQLPVEGRSLDQVLEGAAAVLAAGRRTAPTFFGYVFSPPSPVAVAGDLLASAADQNVTSWRSAPAATHIERITIRWLGQLTGFGHDASGIMLSGGSLANLSALFVALCSCAPPDADRRTLTVYASEEAHFSIAKAAAVVGVELRRVELDHVHRLDVGQLERSIADDRRAGKLPFCVVATAGSTGTGAVDRLDAIAELAARERLWMHVDGAYGALAAADPASRPLFAGIERADSLSIDAHKWLYAPVDCGALLVREADTGPPAFGGQSAAYVKVLAEEALESFAFWDHGLELSRRFRALKVWMTLRHHGARHIGAAIGEDIELARYMGEQVVASKDLELLVEPALSVCCFRHVPAAMPQAQLDRHNERLLQALQADGRVYLSNTTVGGHFALRACITNFRTTGDDIDRTLRLVRELGDQAAAALAP